MASATLTAKGQIVIPAEIRARYQLTPGTQVEFIDSGTEIKLVVRRKITPSDPEAGFGLCKVDPDRKRGKKLSDFDPSSIAGKP